MKRAILTRHAKSSWKNLDLRDHDRPLNERGQKAARKIGGWLCDQNYLPDHVISSTATRCFETWHGVDAVLCSNISPTFQSTLYHASIGAMLKSLQSAEGECVLMLGHNPGIALFAQELLETAPQNPNLYNYPTAATTIIDFEINDWHALELRSGVLRDFVIPRDLNP